MSKQHRFDRASALERSEFVVVLPPRPGGLMQRVAQPLGVVAAAVLGLFATSLWLEYAANTSAFVWDLNGYGVAALAVIVGLTLLLQWVCVAPPGVE